MDGSLISIGGYSFPESPNYHNDVYNISKTFDDTFNNLGIQITRRYATGSGASSQKNICNHF